MSYRQPRVPEITGGETAFEMMRKILLFLKEFCVAAWAANNRRRQEMLRLEKRIAEIEKRMEG